MKKLMLAAAVLAAAVPPGAALAQTVAVTGTVAAGAMHPLAGADHVLAMTALGLLAAQMGGRALWALPLTFVSTMVAGAAAGSAGLPFLPVEPLILGSVIIMGALVALALRLPVGLVLPAVMVFGAAHGWAHGAEGPDAGVLAYFIGFALATAALHGFGLVAGRLLNRAALRGLGGVAAVAGLALAVAG